MKTGIDYSRSLVSLATSIQKYFGVRPSHSTLKEADVLLARLRERRIDAF